MRAALPLPSLKLANGGMPESEVGAALSFGRRRFVPARQEISLSGDEDVKFVVMISGIACRYKMMGDNRAIIGFVLPGDFTIPFASEPMRADFGVASLTECEVVEIPSAELWARAQSNPGLFQALARSAKVDGAIARAWLANISQQPGDKRTAHLLCELRHRFALIGLATQYRFPLPLIQQDLADALGLSFVHVNRVLKGLRRLGLVRSYKHEILVPELGALEQFAEFNPEYLHSGAMEKVPTREDHRGTQHAAARISPAVNGNLSH